MNDPPVAPSTPDADRHEDGSTVDTRRNPTPCGTTEDAAVPGSATSQAVRGAGGRVVAWGEGRISDRGRGSAAERRSGAASAPTTALLT